MRRVPMSVVVLGAVVTASAGEDVATVPRVTIDLTVESAERFEEAWDRATPSTTVIGSEEIRASGAITVADLLRRVPGVDITRSGTLGKAATARIDGAAASQTLVLIDGVELNSPTLGLADLSDLMLDDVERIEVVRGPMSALHGSQAMGGVIQIVTRRGERESRISLDASGGSFGLFRGAIAASGGLGGAATYSLQASRTRLDGRDYSAVRERISNDAYENTTVAGGLKFEIGGASSVDLSLRHYDASRGLPIEVFGAQVFDRNSTQDDRGSALSARFTTRTGKIAPFVRAGYTVADQDFDDPLDAGESGPFASDFSANVKTHLVAIEGGMDAELGASRLIAGAGWERRSGESRDSFAGLNFDDRADTLSAFVQNRWEAESAIAQGDSLVVTAGLRVDDLDSFGTTVNPKLQSLWTAASGFRLRAGIGRGFRAPSLNELYFPFYGNLALAPETSWTYEAAAGGRSRDGKYDLELRVYRSDYRELIATDPETFTAVNLSRARVFGAALELRAQPLSEVFMRGSFTLQNAEDRATGEDLIRRPRRKAAFTIGWERRDVARLALDLLAVGSQRDVVVAGFPANNSGWARVDVAGGVTLPMGLRSFEVYGRVENLLDREYAEVTGFPAPGINARAGVHASF